MKYNSEIHHRKSIRLKGYDYSKEGFYFITICTQNRECLFGEIIEGKMILNNAGLMIEKIYKELPNYFGNANLNEYIIMPNHFHCIIEIVGVESISTHDIQLSNRVDMESTPTTIPNILQTFKRYTTLEYIKMVKSNKLPNFNRRIWQRNYYENIIRNDQIHEKIIEYIKNNPLKWKEDKYHM